MKEIKEKISWDEYFFKMVELIASKSKDPRTKVGCIIVNGKDHAVLSVGFNGLPRGVNDNRIKGLHTYIYDEDNKLKEILSQKPKYLYFEHAERNTIYNAAKHGIKLQGAILYVIGIPCADCARAIIQSGIIKVKILEIIDDVPNDWKQSCRAGLVMMLESGIIVEYYGLKSWAKNIGKGYCNAIYKK